MRGEEGFLRKVLGIFGAAGQPAQQMEYARRMAAMELDECGLVAFEASVDELLVRDMHLVGSSPISGEKQGFWSADL
jgi:hypothetical protein